MSEISNILLSCRNKGVQLWTENGRLRYRAPRGALTQDLLQQLSDAGQQITALLEQATRAETLEPTLVFRTRRDRAPLTFTQLAYWHSNQLATRTTWRGVMRSVRLSGAVDLDGLRASLAQVARRHEALRTRIVLSKDGPTQEIDPCGRCELRIDDLSGSPAPLREAEARRLTEAFLLEPIDVATDPLCGVHLIRLQPAEHILVLAMQHIISDGFSVGILLRDLLATYLSASNVGAPKGMSAALPAIPLQFSDYATWLRSVERTCIETRAAWWTEHLKDARRLQLSCREERHTDLQQGCFNIRLTLGEETTAQLREWCRSRRTTLVMGVLTAYAALALRWCRMSEGILLFQSDGRHSPKVQNTIGYFASQLCLRLTLHESGTFIDLLENVTREYCRAQEHMEFSYLQAQLPRPEVTRGSLFNWLPRAPVAPLPPPSDSASPLTYTEFPLEHPSLRYLEPENELGVLFREFDTHIEGRIVAPRSRFTQQTLESFARNLQLLIDALLRAPDEPVPTPSLQ